MFCYCFYFNSRLYHYFNQMTAIILINLTAASSLAFLHRKSTRICTINDRLAHLIYNTTALYASTQNNVHLSFFGRTLLRLNTYISFSNWEFNKKTFRPKVTYCVQLCEHLYGLSTSNQKGMFIITTTEVVLRIFSRLCHTPR